jgi:hypothetical protein
MMGVVANNEVEANINFQRIPIDINRTDDTLGVGDLYPSAGISWNSGINNYKLYATGDIPVGDYDPKRLANIGIGHGAIDCGHTHKLPCLFGGQWRPINTVSEKVGSALRSRRGRHNKRRSRLMFVKMGGWTPVITCLGYPEFIVGPFGKSRQKRCRSETT